MEWNINGIFLAIVTVAIVGLNQAGILDNTGVLHSLLVVIIFALIHIGTSAFGILNELKWRNINVK